MHEDKLSRQVAGSSVQFFLIKKIYRQLCNLSCLGNRVLLQEGASETRVMHAKKLTTNKILFLGEKILILWFRLSVFEAAPRVVTGICGYTAWFGSEPLKCVTLTWQVSHQIKGMAVWCFLPSVF